MAAGFEQVVAITTPIEDGLDGAPGRDPRRICAGAPAACSQDANRERGCYDGGVPSSWSASARASFTHRGRRIDPSQIKRVALLTVEGEHDDISAVGQTEAAHVLCANIPADDKAHYLQPGVGHYGVFNGSRFRAEIAPRIADFVLTHNGRRGHGSGAHPGPAKAASARR